MLIILLLFFFSGILNASVINSDLAQKENLQQEINPNKKYTLIPLEPRLHSPRINLVNYHYYNLTK